MSKPLNTAALHAAFFLRGIYLIFNIALLQTGSRDSSVGIATRYGLEGPGIESRWVETFRTYPDRLRAPPSLLYNEYRVFLGSKCGRGVMLTTQPLLVLRLRKSWAIRPLTLWVLLGLLRGYLYPPFTNNDTPLKLTLWRLMTYIYIYMSYRTANLQALHFIYLVNKYTYWIF
jgi:hypothetical protein